MKNNNKKVLTVVYVGALILLLFSTAVIPGLNSKNQYVSIGAGCVGLLSILFGYFYLKYAFYKEDEFGLFSFDDLKEPETELDYNPDFLRKQLKQNKTKRKPKPTNRKQKTPA